MIKVLLNRAILSGAAFIFLSLLLLNASVGKAIFSGLLFGGMMTGVDFLMDKKYGKKIADEVQRMRNSKPPQSK